MERRVLEKSGIEVSPLGMGCMGLMHASGDLMLDAEAERVVREAYEMGYTFFDTAECYVGMRPDGTEAHNEDVVGAAVAPVRDSVVIASKFGIQHAADRTPVMDSSPATIGKSAEGSSGAFRPTISISAASTASIPRSSLRRSLPPWLIS